MTTADNILGADERPRFFAFESKQFRGLEAPKPRLDTAVRAYVRSLGGMQKEALVVSSETPRAWRLVSDEGPDLGGHDEAPFPLAFLTAGMLASYVTEILALAEQRDIPIADLRLSLDSYYTMTGSALRGTMVGGALSPVLHVQATTTADMRLLHALCSDAVHASPVNGLLRQENRGQFTLTVNGRELAPTNVEALSRPAEADIPDRYDEVRVDDTETAEELTRRAPSDATLDLPTGEGFASAQHRTLHVRGISTMGEEGIKLIEVQLVSPRGGTFHLKSDEPSRSISGSRAPDAATLIAAGIAFCFMTQFGRYATITKKQLDRYRVIQDMHFSVGGASGRTSRAGQSDAVETHVYLDTPEDDDFAAKLLDMGEQTCFLHALCRMALKVKLKVSGT